LPSLQERIMEAEEQRGQRGRVWQAPRRVASDLEQSGVPYAIVGALA
jgi:hypothetical protein